MQFEKDIFISYAHIDDQQVILDQPGWITEFHRGLKAILSQKMGAEPKIWRDLKLQGNQQFGSEIVDQFSNAAIMISILSPRYINSDWCQKEVNEFYELCNKNYGFVINNKARIFKVIKTPISLDLQPEYLRGSLGYEFYETDPVSQKNREYYPFLDPSVKCNYYLKLTDLVDNICSFLQELKAAALPAMPVKLPIKNDGQVSNIYLSESSFDTRPLRDNIKRELEAHGYSILPQGHLPLEEPLLREEVKNYLKESQLSIHLVGNNYGVVPEGSDKSIIELQTELAAVSSSSDKLKRLIWIPENVDPSEDRQRNFLQRLNNGNSELMEGADLVKSTIEVFKEAVFDKIASMKQKPDSGSKSAPEAVGKMVYIICDVHDRDLIKDIRRFFFEKGVEPLLPIFDDNTDETQIREDHKENLVSCDGAIVFYGGSNEAWFRAKLKDFDKYGNSREKPFAFKAVYMAPPQTDSKEFFLKPGWDKIDGILSFPGNELNKLLSKL